jgi:hypothetical protein
LAGQQGQLNFWLSTSVQWVEHSVLNAYAADRGKSYSREPKSADLPFSSNQHIYFLASKFEKPLSP